MRLLAAAVLLTVAACAEPMAPLEGIDLPPASLPDQIEEGIWAVSFIHEFGEGFWEEGNHVYQLALDCSEIDSDPIASSPISFQVSPLNPPIDLVFLRLSGLADSLLGPANVGAFNPQQATAAVITVLGLSESQARGAMESCAGTVTWDLAGSADLLPSELFQS